MVLVTFKLPHLLGSIESLGKGLGSERLTEGSEQLFWAFFQRLNKGRLSRCFVFPQTLKTHTKQQQCFRESWAEAANSSGES